MNEYLSNGRLWRLCQKELRESLRDRRTLFTLVLMPILVYPLLSMALQRLVIGSVSKSKADTVYVLGIGDEESANQIQQLMADARRAIANGFVSPITILRPAEQPDTDSVVGASDPAKNEESNRDTIPKFDILVAEGSYTEDLFTGKMTNMTLEAGVDIGSKKVTDKLGVEVGGVGIEVGVTIEIDGTGVNGWEVKDHGVKGKVGLEGGNITLIGAEGKISLKSGKPSFEVKSDMSKASVSYK